MAEFKLPYDPKDKHSIEAYALVLLNKSLREKVEDALAKNGNDKGELGNLVQSLYFHVPVNSNPEPDFVEAGVELKVTPIKLNVKPEKYVAKERLVLGIINYLEEITDFESSKLWKKNKLILLMQHLHEEGKLKVDQIFMIIQLWEFPEKDLEIIKSDWKKITDKITAGKAHELSERDTLYLAASTKGGKGKENSTMRHQPNTETKAPQRAYSLKPSYMNTIIDGSGIQIEMAPFIKKPEQLQKGKTFEELVVDKFKPYYGKTESQIWKALKLPPSKSKSARSIMVAGILGVFHKKKIEEFEKANILVKTIKLTESGGLKESMSFQQIKYMDIVNEDWENSYFHDVITKRFFFTIFQENAKKELVLRKVMFWGMPDESIELAHEYWEDTKSKIAQGNFKGLIRLSDNRMFHVRPKAKNKKDVMLAPDGTMQQKKAYWINASYIKSIIK